MDGGIDKDPTKSLQDICDLALQAKIYPECMKNYPFVLGAQSLRMIDLEERSLKDLAETSGTTSGNAAVRVHRAREALRKQVQVACDQAKNGAARLAGVEPPKFEDNETTIPQLKERIGKHGRHTFYAFKVGREAA